MLSLDTEGRSVIAEQFRIFRTNMDFLIAQKKGGHILITSSMTGEGKSFIAMIFDLLKHSNSYLILYGKVPYQ